MDWIKVDLLVGPAPNTAFSQTGFLLADGAVVGTDGAPMVIAAAPPGTCSVRISHRNHAALIANPVFLSAANTAAPAVPIPTLSPPMLGLLGVVLAGWAGLRLRRRRPPRRSD